MDIKTQYRWPWISVRCRPSRCTQHHLSQWAGIRNKIRAFLGGINSENKDEQIYRHPFAGPLDISDTLHFIVVHFDNHLRQIDKIEAQMER